MCLKSCLGILVYGIIGISHFQVLKQFATVARLVVIGIEHFCCHGLAKAAGTTHAGHSRFRIECAVDIQNQFRLVNIFTTPRANETHVVSIYVNTHICITTQGMFAHIACKDTANIYISSSFLFDLTKKVLSLQPN